ncbi:uncharacterized protein PAE49_020872 [Odontesthes bonariensis]
MDPDFVRIPPVFLKQIATGSLREDLRGVILRALPAASAATQQALFHKLLGSGLRSTKDLKSFTAEDVGGVLPAAQLQRLLREFKNETGGLTLGPEMFPRPVPAVRGTVACPRSRSHQERSGSDGGPSSAATETLPEAFQVPWNLMSMEIRTAVADGRRPSAADRRQMVRVLVDQMRKYELKPKRSRYRAVCRDLVLRFPRSFADLHSDGQLLGDGCASLVNQVRNRIDSLNRNASVGQKRGATPLASPDAAVDQKRRRLEEIHRQEGPVGAGAAEVKRLMESTFCLQRRRINAVPPPSVAALRAQWPYLFTPRGLYAHFALLTEVDVLRALERSLEECGRTVTRFFTRTPTNAAVRAALSRLSCQELPLSIVQLLMAHFCEDPGGLILWASAPSTAADVERTLVLPATPRLILLVSNGAPGSPIRRWMVSLEGSVICEGSQPSFLSGLAAVFSTYYTFNLQYEGEAARTLEFIQRRFVGINPETDTRAGGGRLVSRLSGKGSLRKTTPVNPHVVTLLQKLVDFM